MILLFESVAANPDWNRGEQEQEAEYPVEGEENDETDNDCDAVGNEEHETERQPTTNQAEVTGGAAEQLPAWPLVVKGNRKILKLGIEGAAKTGLDVGAWGEHQPAAKQNHDGLEQTEAKNGNNGRKQGFKGAVLVEAVHQGAQELRDSQGKNVGGECSNRAQNHSG